MTTIVTFAFSFAGIVTAVLIAVAWVQFRPASIVARKFLVGLTVGFTAASLYVVPYGVSRLLVFGYHEMSPSDAPSGRTAIVVLGSADYLVLNWNRERFSILDLQGAARIWEAFRVYRFVSDGWVISSGGAVGPQPQNSDSGGSTTGPSMLTPDRVRCRIGPSPSKRGWS